MADVQIPSKAMHDALAARVAALESAARDTGWRDISGLLDPAVWTVSSLAGRFQVRRAGVWVTIVARIAPVVQMPSDAANAMVTMPSGFRPPNSSYSEYGTFRRGSTKTHHITGLSTNYRLDVVSPGATIETTETVAFTIVYATSDVWPSTLPGTAA